MLHPWPLYIRHTVLYGYGAMYWIFFGPYEQFLPRPLFRLKHPYFFKSWKWFRYFLKVQRVGVFFLKKIMQILLTNIICEVFNIQYHSFNTLKTTVFGEWIFESPYICWCYFKGTVALDILPLLQQGQMFVFWKYVGKFKNNC